MRPLVIVFFAPETDDLSGMGDVFEPVLVQAFVTQFAVKAFDVAILYGLAGIYEYMVDSFGIRPRIHRIAGEFRTVVAEDFPRHPVKQDGLVQKVGNVGRDKIIYPYALEGILAASLESLLHRKHK